MQAALPLHNAMLLSPMRLDMKKPKGIKHGTLWAMSGPATPSAQPPASVTIPLHGSNTNFIFNCSSPQREFAQLMYISGLYEDILDSPEF